MRSVVPSKTPGERRLFKQMNDDLARHHIATLKAADKAERLASFNEAMAAAPPVRDMDRLTYKRARAAAIRALASAR